MDSRRRIPCPAALLLSVACGIAHGTEGLATALGECRQIDDDRARLICFDAVAAMSTADERDDETTPTAAAETPQSSAAATDAESAQPAAAATVESTAGIAPEAADDIVPLTDEVGLERVDGVRQAAPPTYSSRVTRCEVNRQSGQTYFFLENGQVWKQANYRRLNLRDCRFDVTLSKDTFGYELAIPEKDRTVRVSRIR